jgi:hypothetical protein
MKNNNKPKARWNDADRFAFATQKLRANSIPGRRQDGPMTDEWGWEDDEDDEDDD